MTDLSILARTLAERLREPLRFVRSHVSTQVDLEENFMQRIEAAIREAIDKTLEEAEQATCAFCRSGAELVGQQHKLLTSENNMTSYSYTYIDCDAAAIRSLKQSNSGMEVRK